MCLFNLFSWFIALESDYSFFFGSLFSRTCNFAWLKLVKRQTRDLRNLRITILTQKIIKFLISNFQLHKSTRDLNMLRN